MFYTSNFKITLSMLTKSNYVSNKGFLSLLQDIAEMHSAAVGYGITDIDKTGFSWALLNWKVKIISRPKYGDVITINTWSRYSTKLYSYRDFEVLNSNGEVIAIATSKWVLIDVKKGRIAKIEDDLIGKYYPENKSVFDLIELPKIEEPNNYTSFVNYSIRKADIDINNHVNNLFYLDMATEAFPDDPYKLNTCTEFEILYKHQIKLDDKVVAHYTLENNTNYIVVKSEDGKTLHSIMKFI